MSDSPPSGALALDEAIEWIRAGGALLTPTETVIGLCADAMNESAVTRVFEIKGRPKGKAMPVVVADMAMVDRVAVGLSGRARRLAEAFWPGPLSLVLRAQPGLPRAVTGGGETVAVRAPGHAALRELIGLGGVPLAAPSANRSGEPSCATLPEARQVFRTELEAGTVASFEPATASDSTGVPSTVLIPGETPGSDRVLREGPITLAALREIE